jgi:hypothetical protein
LQTSALSIAGHVLGLCIEHKAVQGFRQGGKHLVLFDDVDINTRVEPEVSDQKYVMPQVIRAANRKSFRALHDEIRAEQAAEV